MKNSVKALFVSALAVGMLNAPAAMAQAEAGAVTGAGGAAAGAGATAGLTVATVGTAIAVGTVLVVAENSDGTTGSAN